MRLSSLKFLTSFIFLCLQALLTFSQSKIESTSINKAALPKEISYEGKLINALKWTDASGANLVIISETGEYQSHTETDESFRDARLFGYHFLKKNNRFVQTWKVQDFVVACPVDIEAEFLPNTFQVTDLNNNGTAEIWLMYKTACHGDVSPSTMKIIMYEGQKKFAIRGRNRVEYEKGKFNGGEFTFDQAFKIGPLAFRDFAKKLWLKNSNQVWD